jgi:hypothetical protein
MRPFPYKNLPEFRIFKKYNTPSKIQDFLDTIPINFELGGETYRRPLHTLKHNKAHCMEGALLAASMLWYHGYEPLLMDFRTSKDDPTDHVVAVFKFKGFWGAISKTNHNVLRYRDPVYKSERELAMSYFNEYFGGNRRKSLREYSKPYSLLKYPDTWLTDKKHAQDIVSDLDNTKHFKVVPKHLEKYLRPIDKLEFVNSKPVEWYRPKKKKP